jgi:peptidoglycan/LPS O-acetylase OafA/YrhL
MDGAKTLAAQYCIKPLLRPVMPELDSIRGIAVLGVFFYHGLYWNVNLLRFPGWVRAVLTGM